MRCTSCSARIRPVVAIDIDGTLADYHYHFHTFAAGYLGVAVAGYKGEQPHREWFCEQTGVSVRTFRDIKLAYRQGAQKRSQPIYSGARELTASVARIAELWLTTTRPFNRLDNIDPDTRAWLERYEIAWDYMLADDDKYDQLAERIEPGRLIAVVEDLPEQYSHAAALFGERVPILIDREHNGRFDARNRIGTLRGVKFEILNRALEWSNARHRS